MRKKGGDPYAPSPITYLLVIRPKAASLYSSNNLLKSIAV